ncbi:A/G-specific adenine glycosylase [Pseudarthrobacter sp. J1738]|uniref:A/G-specific adenine glycosylase n=1 Tax=Pseudarthrobacter sp. J1738 TaxID=3420446 RepID=UPI003D28C7C0
MGTTSHLSSVPEPATLSLLHNKLADWFHNNGRDLPWRTLLRNSPECTAWGILVSEIMLQQTPVVRVLPVWEQWMQRWPTPDALAAEPSGEAVRAWGRLGYPRRALRLHAAAIAITEAYDGVVPAAYQDLLSLPGVGSYTAAAVSAFAYGRRTTVVDTNIRRVHARLVSGTALPAQSLTAAETQLANELLPEDPAASVMWNAAVMELGALICTARSPKCAQCPVAAQCQWRAQGQPPPSYIPKGQPWHGTDRQLRGAVMAVLREAEQPVAEGAFFVAPVDLHLDSECISVPLAALHGLNPEPERLERILAGLVNDGLAKRSPAGIQLPS